MRKAVQRRHPQKVCAVKDENAGSTTVFSEMLLTGDSGGECDSRVPDVDVLKNGLDDTQRMTANADHLHAQIAGNESTRTSIVHDGMMAQEMKRLRLIDEERMR